MGLTQINQLRESRKANGRKQRPSRCCSPRLELLEDRILLDAGFSNLADKLDTRISDLGKGLSSIVSTTASLPILNQPIQSVAGQVITSLDQFRADLIPALRTLNSTDSQGTIHDALFNALSNNNLLLAQKANDLLHSLNPADTLNNDVVVTTDPATGTIRISLNVANVVSISKGFTFGLGLPVIPFQVDTGALQVSAGFGYTHLSFGLQNGAPFIDTGSAPGALQAAVGAGLKNGQIVGSLGFLTVTATTPTAAGDTSLKAYLSMDPGGVAKPVLGGQANVNLHIATDFTAVKDSAQGFALPNVSTDFHMQWDLNGTDPSASLGSGFGQEPVVEFNNVSFGLGSYLSNVLKPIVNTVHDVLTPFEPIFAVLDARIPGLSDLSETAKLGPTSLISLAKLASASHLLPPDYQLLVDLVVTLDDANQDIKLIETSGNQVAINVGSFNLTGNNLRQSFKIDFNSPNLTDLIPTALAGAQSVLDQIKAKAPPVVQTLFTSLIPDLGAASNGVGFDFPLLRNPRDGIFKFILGEDVDFANFTAKFHVNAYETQLLPFWGPVSVRLNGAVDLDAYFKLAYDTYGLRKFIQTGDGKQLANGFYFDASQDLIHLNGSISAGLALTAPLPVYLIPSPIFGYPIPIEAIASVNGSLTVHDLRVHFPGNGKVRFFESLPKPLFQTSGYVTADLNIAVEVGIPLIKTVELFPPINLASTVVIDLDNGPLANPANPFINPPPTPPVPKEWIIDLRRIKTASGQIVGNRGVLESIDVSPSGSNVTVTINKFVYHDSRSAALVSSITVIGADDDDSLSVDGAIKKPVQFIGGHGANALGMNDASNRDIVATYSAKNGIVQRTGLTLNGTIDVLSVTFSNLDFLTLATSGNSVVTQVNVVEPVESQLFLALGNNGLNNVKIDVTDAGLADRVLVSGSARDAVLVQDRSTRDGADWVLTDGEVARLQELVIHLPNGKVKDLGAKVGSTIDYFGIGSVALQAGDGANTFSIRGTPAGVKTSITGGAGDDTFVVGQGRNLLDYIFGPLTIDGGGGNDRLVLNDQANVDLNVNPAPGQSFRKTQPFYTITDHQIKRENIVLYVGAFQDIINTINYSHIRTLEVNGGQTDENYTVENTPSQLVSIPGHTFENAMTIINGGSGDDTLNVNGTTGPLTVNFGAGANQAFFGAATLDRIKGGVNLLGHISFLNFSDIERAPRTFTLKRYELDRTVAAPIQFHDVDFLALSGGGNDTFNIDDTRPVANNGYFTRVTTSKGSSQVFVHGTTGDLYLNLQGAGDSAVISGQDGSLDPIQGKIDIQGLPGHQTVGISDAGSKVAQLVTIADKVVQRSGAADIVFQPLKPAAPQWLPTELDFQDGAGGTFVDVVSTAASTLLVVRGAPGAVDQFSVEANADKILGPLTLIGQQADGDIASYLDANNPTAHDYTMTPTGISRDGLATVSFLYLTAIDLYAAALGGNKIDALGVLQGTSAKINAANSDTVTVGNLPRDPRRNGGMSFVNGPLSVRTDFNSTDHIKLILDDSTNDDSTPQRITFSMDASNVTTMDGLAPASIDWLLNAGSSVMVLGGAVNKTFGVNSFLADTPLSIDGGRGVNTLDYSAYSGVTGLVAWYPGEGDATDTIGGNNGVLHGSLAFVPGEVGQAFSFNGVDAYVQVPRAAVQESTQVSVDAWVNATAPGRNTYILAKGASDDAAASYALYTGPESGLRFYIFDAANFVESPDAGAGIWDGQWHHVVGAYDGANVRLYVDGAEVGSGTSTNLQIQYALPTSTDLFIGSYNGDSQHDFTGLIDEPSIFNRALSPAEIQTFFAAGSAGKTALASGVYVNLQTGTASALAGITNIQNVTGSPFDDILVGNGGNVLDGGAGHNLLIAGAGPSTLFGGNGDDILIGGTTSYDTDQAGLQAILAEWTANHDTPFLDVTTVHSNQAVNQLSGEAGHDLFFARLKSERLDFDESRDAWVQLT